jgi:hydrogenase maturation protease
VDNDCIGYILGKRLEKEFSHHPHLIIRELTGSPLQIMTEISPYPAVLLIDAVYTGRDLGEIILFDIHDMKAYEVSCYIHGMNISEAITAARRLGLRVPEGFLLAGIEAGGKHPQNRHKTGNGGTFGGNLSPPLQEKIEEIYLDLTAMIRDFLADHLSPA